MVQGKSINVEPDFGIGSIDGFYVTLKFTRKNSPYTSEHHIKIIKKGYMEGTLTSNANQKGNSKWHII